MGGNAITNARRIVRTEMDKIISEVTALLPEIKLHPVLSYRTKPDFGDIDLVTATSATLDIKALIKNRLQLVEFYDNGPFFSAAYKGVQVDFIFMPEEHIESSLAYFHWNDLGNFLGRTARSMNFKYGHDGFTYEKHYSDHYKYTVHVSRDIPKILEFMGYDPVRWSEGFDTKQDIFAYAMDSIYFNATYFLLEQQGHNDRVRNKKRKMYQDFLVYLNSTNVIPKPKLTPEERLFHFYRAVDFFGDDFANRAMEAEDRYDRTMKVREIFNGEFIGKVTGLAGKELGALIKRMKTEPDYETKVIEEGENYVRQLIKKYGEEE